MTRRWTNYHKYDILNIRTGKKQENYIIQKEEKSMKKFCIVLIFCMVIVGVAGTS